MDTKLSECPLCKAEELDLDLVAAQDHPDKEYAYNLYVCSNCSGIIKQDVWKNRGLLVIDHENSITRLPSNCTDRLNLR